MLTVTSVIITVTAVSCLFVLSHRVLCLNGCLTQLLSGIAILLLIELSLSCILVRSGE